MEFKFNAEKVNEADENGMMTANVDISTKEAIGALAKNAKVKLKEGWTWAKPKLKVIAGVGAIMGAGAYIATTLNSDSMAGIEKDDNANDDEIDGEFELCDDQADLDDGQQDNLDNNQDVEEG